MDKTILFQKGHNIQTTHPSHLSLPSNIIQFMQIDQITFSSYYSSSIFGHKDEEKKYFTETIVYIEKPSEI